MKPRLHRCAAESCQRQVPGHLLMCMDHWRMVPVALRREVLRTYRVMNNSRSSVSSIQEYRTAVANAVAALVAKQVTRQERREEAGGDLFAMPAGPTHNEQSEDKHGNTTKQGRRA